MPKAVKPETATISLRVKPLHKARLARAAAYAQSDLSKFMLQAALEKAEAVIAREERIELNEAQTRMMLDLLDNPPQPTPALVEAARSLARDRVSVSDESPAE